MNVICCSQAIEILVDQHISDQQAEADRATVAAAAAAAAVASASAAPNGTFAGAGGYRNGSSEMMACTPTRQAADHSTPQDSSQARTSAAEHGQDSSCPCNVTPRSNNHLITPISDSSPMACEPAEPTGNCTAEAMAENGACRDPEGAAASNRAEAASSQENAAATAAPPVLSPAPQSETKRTAAASRRKTRHQPPRNRNCVCGSGRKFKACCGSIQSRAVANAASVAPDRQLAQLLI